MDELKRIQKILKTHKIELKKKYKIKEIGIFGSYVRREQRKGSDVDILVEFDEVPDFLKFIEIENYLQRLLKKKVDLVRKNAIRQELRELILNEVIEA